MKNDDPGSQRQKKKRAAAKVDLRWALTMLGWTFALSMLLSFLASNALENIGYLLAFLLLGAFILLGVCFDVIGIATASASEKPFHAMAANKVPGSFEALKLVRKAEKVSSFCNDVVGDIAGIISGTTGAVIVSRLSVSLSLSSVLTQLLISGLVAGLTVGGKAAGKSLAINYSTEIVFFVGRVLRFFKRIGRKPKNGS